ncbi:uncharacterized protein A4U43_C02F10220 [Asparagus officinalis]|uniref:AN1-type domain-containing protein n=1 Tax=Asparagus officinalis TaxID=4686 RepID=A0A5P1FK21_ASPOF|nr:zinc finger AN1 domain-containing stress-associated protein 15-like [Asparagus officinalis]ONK77757.1 uncharacterized protein A4U43_C02F10220 [Asparagus officinalis]
MAQESCNLDKDEAEILKPSSPPPTQPSSPSSTAAPLCLKPSKEFEFSAEKPDRPTTDITCGSKAERESQSLFRFFNRCSCCRKKVGLTGFRCRCGELFCSRHRYSETHDCSFDYKALGREEISKANPLIRAAKIIKI